MPTHNLTACGQSVRIVAPRPGEFDELGFARFAAAEEMLGLDVEGTAITRRGHADPNWRLRLVQLASPAEAWVLDPADPAQRAALLRVLADPGQWFVTHTNYDVLSVWWAFGIALGQRVLDAHLVSKLINPDELAGHGLKELCARHLDRGLITAETQLHEWFQTNAPKSVRGKNKKDAWGWNNVPVDLPAYTIYAGLDAIYVRTLLPILLTICHPVSHLVVMEHWLAAQTTGATIRGMQLDMEYVNHLLQELQAEHNEAEATITAALGFGGRSPRFADWVVTQTPLPANLARTPKAGRLKLTTQIDGVTVLVPALVKAAESWSPEARHLLLCKATITRTANLLSNLRQFVALRDTNNRVHPSINTLRAKTARMSVTEPAAQTFKKTDGRLRHCYIAEPDHVLVASDFSQVEVRVAAALSRDKTLMEVIRNGEDVHNVTANALWGPGYTRAQRTVGKRATFGTIYGGGAPGLAAQTGVAESEARGIVEKWHRQYPGIRRYSKAVGRLDTVITASGRRVPADRLRRYANINYAVQSTSRDLLVEAAYILLVREGLSQYLWMFVHDEIILSVPEQDAPHIRDLMEKAMTGIFWGVPIKADAKILGTHWGKLGEEND